MKYLLNAIKPFLALIVLAGVTAQVSASEHPAPSADYKPTQAEKSLEENSLKQAFIDFIDHNVYNKVPVKSYHQKLHQNGSSCELCHGSSEPVTPADTKNCANCHGTPSDVAKLTEEMHPNPHNSPHWEDELPCDSCHMEHSESESVCKNCHQFGFEPQ